MRKLLLIGLLFIVPLSSCLGQKNKAWSYEWGLQVFDIESTLLPMGQFGFGYHFQELANDMSLSANIDPGFYLYYDSFYGLSHMIDLPLSVNFNIGHRVTSEYFVDQFLGATAGLGYEYTSIGLNGNSIQLHGPFVQVGLRIKIFDNSFYIKGRLQQSLVPINEINPAMIHLVVGQPF